MSPAIPPPTAAELVANIKPRDAATLIVIESSDSQPRILMGRRSMKHTFMPGAYVFPGGRVDPDDAAMATHDDFAPALLDKLLFDMKRGPSIRRARALALAAIRETWEEVGIMLGAESAAVPQRVPAGWQDFPARGVLPALSALRFVGRAITPPRRKRRYDTRFFATFSNAIAHRIPVEQVAGGELEDVCWLTFEEARKTNLPGVTLDMIDHLERRLAQDPDLGSGGAIPYYYTRHGKRAQQEI